MNRGWRRFWQQPEPSSSLEEEKGLFYWRERILSTLYLTGMLAGLVAYIPIVIFLLTSEQYTLAGVDTLVVVWATLANIFRSRMPFGLRAGAALAIMFAVGLMVLVSRGLLSGGLLWLFAFASVSGVLLGLRAAFAALVVNAVTLTVLGLLAREGHLGWPWFQGESLASWWILSLNFLLMNALVSVSVAVMARGLSASLVQEKRARNFLDRERAELAALNTRLKRESAERLQAETELRRAHERFRTVLDSLDAVVYVADLEDHRILFANRRLKQGLGSNPEGRVCWQVLRDDQDGPCEFCTNARLLTQAGEPAPPCDWEYKYPLGHRWFAIRDRAIRWVDGRLVRLEIALDITERKRVEEALAQSEERLRFIFDNLKDFIYTHDLQGRFLTVNRGATLTLGYEPEELVGRSVEEMLPLPHNRIFRGRYLPAVLERGSHRGVTMFVDKKGAPHFIEYVSVLVREEGRPAYVYGSARDVTERRQAERRLKDSEERYRATFEQAAVGVCEVDTQDRFIRGNRRFSELLGYERHELLQMSMGQVSHPDDRKPEMGLIKRLERGEIETYTVEKRYLKKDGSLLWGNTTVSMVPEAGGGPKYFVMLVEDITERKAAEEALKQSEEKYRTTFQSVPLAITICDADTGRFLEVNEGFSQISGYSRWEALGKTATNLGLFANSPEQQKLEATLEREGEVHAIEVQYNCKDGRVIDTVFSARPIRYEGQDCLLTVVSDVSAERHAQREQARLQGQLMQAQKMEAVGTLAGGIAHDFNNILQAIGGYIQLIGQIVDERSRVGKYAAQIETSVEHAADLVKRLLTFSRKVEPELSPVDLNQEVKLALSILERTLPRMITIETKLAEDIWPVSGDSGQLEQVLLNLGGNARDAMPEGGTLSVETDNVELDEEYCRQRVGVVPGQYVRLTVSDTGHGIDSGDKVHIFEPFFTTKPVGEGTGLGLSTVFGIVKAHQGHITCQSQVGRGARFCIFLPAMAGEASQIRPQTRPKAQSFPQGQGETIMLVDDENSVTEAAGEYLSTLGYRIITADSGEQALETHTDHADEINLVVLDVGMPGMGGRACLKVLMERDPTLPVIIASGYGMAGPAGDLTDLGARAFLPKPYRLDDLVRTIRQVLAAMASQKGA